MNVIPFGKGGQRTKHKHKQGEVKQTEEDRRKRRSDHHPGRHDPRYAQDNNSRIENDRNNSKKHSGTYRHEHVIAGKARSFRIGKNALKQLSAIPKKHLIKALSPTKTLIP